MWEYQQLITDEPVEFEKEPVEVEDCRKITDQFRGIYRMYPNLIKENQRMSTCNRLDLQILGSQPVMPKNLPDYCGVRDLDHAFAHPPYETTLYCSIYLSSFPKFITMAGLMWIIVRGGPTTSCYIWAARV